MTIWKEPFRIADEVTVELPDGSRILSAGMDLAGVSCIWFLCDPDAPKTPRKIMVRCTGHPISGDEGNYLNSFNMGPFVWHVFVPVEPK